MSATLPKRRDPAVLALALVAAVTLWRVAVLALDAPNLSFDEAQYWAWAQTLQLGYYSKPPFVAWSIAATTAVCGDGEGCVKLGSTLAHAGTALALLGLGTALYGRAVGAWAAALWITMPAVSLSAVMITTDPFLLFFWALALLCLARAAENPAATRWWVGLGLAFGFGLLAKYAMVLFAAGLALWLAWDRERRALLKARGLWLAAALGLAVYAPNALWNAANGFVSYAHTRDNANLEGQLFHPDKLAEFLGGQFGVFGPILFAALVLALAAACRRTADGRVRMLAAFALPVLALMTVQAFLSRANANWTAPAFVSGTVLVAAFLAGRGRAWLTASLALHLLAAGVMYELDAVRAIAGYGDTVRMDPMKRIRGWDQVGERVSAHLAAHPGARLMADERKVLATLIYYVRPHPFDAVKWNPGGQIHDHYDQTTRLEPGPGEIIFVTEDNPDAKGVAERFQSAERLEDVRIPVHADYARAVTVWRLAGFRGYR